jgi:hypothetical protein
MRVWLKDKGTLDDVFWLGYINAIDIKCRTQIVDGLVQGIDFVRK